jgi:hypothetical protein
MAQVAEDIAKAVLDSTYVSDSRYFTSCSINGTSGSRNGTKGSRYEKRDFRYGTSGSIYGTSGSRYGTSGPDITQEVLDIVNVIQYMAQVAADFGYVIF